MRIYALTSSTGDRSSSEERPKKYLWATADQHSVSAHNIYPAPDTHPVLQAEAASTSFSAAQEEGLGRCASIDLAFKTGHSTARPTSGIDSSSQLRCGSHSALYALLGGMEEGDDEG